MRASARKVWWMGVLVAVLAIGAMVCGAVSAEALNGPAKKLSWTVGVGSPSGSGVSDNYGSVWLNLQGNYRLANSERNEQGISFGVAAGTKSRDFSVYDNFTYLNSGADFSARLFSIKYDYAAKKSASPLYWGGGAGIYFVNTEATYNAPEGHVWIANNSKELSFSKTQTVIAPHIKVGYQIRDKVGIELGYTMLNTTLAGNTSQYSELPSVPDVKLSSILTLSANMRF